WAAARWADRRLEDMRGGGRAFRDGPVSVGTPKEGGLVLRAGDGDPKIRVVLRLAPERRRAKLAQAARDLRVVHVDGGEDARVSRRLAFRQEAQRPDAVAADRRQEIEGARRRRAFPGGDARAAAAAG